MELNEYGLRVWKHKTNKRLFTKKDYNNYMKVVNENISETERRLKTLDKSKKVSQLSFEDWVKFQNGKLKIS